MKFNISWLKRHLEFDLETVKFNQICNTLTDLGIEVESSFEFQKNDYDNIFVAKILEAEKHPNADKLKVCKVSDGENIYQIVCGAPNARKGIKVAMSKIGAIIPHNKMQIVRSNIRGVESEGMLCSAKELNIQDESDGILELDESLAIGGYFFDEFKLDEKSYIEVKVTPNMGDKTSVYGICRDLAARKVGKFKHIDDNTNLAINFGNSKNIIKISDQISSKNIHYAIKLKNNDFNYKAPQWIKEKLEIYGLKIQENIQDIINFMNIDLGLGMFLLDSKNINFNEELSIEYANQNETIQVENKNYSLSNTVSVIKNDNKILQVLGIVNDDLYQISKDSQEVLLICSYIEPEIVVINRNYLLLNSEPSYRFERGIDPSILEYAINSTFCLIEQSLHNIIIDDLCISKQNNIINLTLDYNISNLQRIVGVNIDLTKIKSILHSLNFKVLKDSGDILQLQIPTFRHDISCQEDITEEIIRIAGYDLIEAKPFLLKSNNITNNDQKLLNILNKIKVYLSHNGYKETISLPMISKDSNAIFGNTNDKIEIINPLTQDHCIMRESILSNLIDILLSNQRIDLDSLAFFEEGLIFNHNNDLQVQSIAGIKYGNKTKKTYLQEQTEYDILDVKEDLIEIVKYFNSSLTLEIKKLNEKFAHPNKAFELYANNNKIAIFGEINPKLLKHLKIHKKVFFFELNITKILNISHLNFQYTAYKENNIQPIIREFSFIVDANLLLSEMLELEEQFKKDNYIDKITLLDVYSYNNNDCNEKSISLKFLLKPDKIIDTNEIENISQNIISNFKIKLNARLRDGIEAL